MAAGGRAHQSDARRIDAKFSRLAANELHAGKNVLHGLREHFALGGEAVADREHGDAARREIWPPILERGAHALHPAAAVHGNQRRRGLGAFRQVKVAGEFDAVMIGVSDASCVVTLLIRRLPFMCLSRLDLARGVNRLLMPVAQRACRYLGARWQSAFHVVEQQAEIEKNPSTSGRGKSVASSRGVARRRWNADRLIDRGSGPPILFLHAENGIEPAAAAIEELAKGARVIAPTHPGFGRSEVPKGMRTIDDLSYFYLDMLDQLDFATHRGRRRLGAWIAAEIAVKTTARMARLVMANAVGVKVGDRETRDIADIFALTDHGISRHRLFRLQSRPARLPGVPDGEVLAAARAREATARFAWKPYFHNPGSKAGCIASASRHCFCGAVATAC